MSRSEEILGITRRAAVGTLAAAGVGFALLGPRGGKERSDGRLVLDYWEKWTGLEGRAMLKMVDEFNQSQDRIFVRYFSTNAIAEKTKVAIAGGNPPDIVGLWNYNVAGYADTGAIIPLSEISCKPEHKVRIERYAQAMRPVMEYGGKVWAVVNTGGSLAMYYNKAHFKEAGLDPSKPPLTIAQMDAANHALTRVSADGTVLRAGFVHLEPGWWSFHWGQHFGGAIYDPSTGRSTVACPENIKAYEWLQSYSKRFGEGDTFDGADPEKNRLLKVSSLEQIEKFRSSFGNYDSKLNAFLSGKISMVIQGPWLANVLKAYAPDIDYGVTPFPVAEHLYDAANPIGLIDTDILVVPKGVRHPEACMEFIAFTQTQRVVEYLSTVHCKNSPLAEASPDFLASHPNKGVQVFASVANSNRGFRCPQTRTWLQFKDVCDALMQQTWTQKGPAATLLANAQDRSQMILDDAARANELRNGLRGGKA